MITYQYKIHSGLNAKIWSNHEPVHTIFAPVQDSNFILYRLRKVMYRYKILSGLPDFLCTDSYVLWTYSEVPEFMNRFISKTNFFLKMNSFNVFYKKPLEKQLTKSLPTSNHFYFEPFLTLKWWRIVFDTHPILVLILYVLYSYQKSIG
jgi:hypothetical protein